MRGRLSVESRRIGGEILIESGRWMQYLLPFGMLGHMRIHSREERRIFQPTAESPDETRAPIAWYGQPRLDVGIVHFPKQWRRHGFYFGR